MYNMKEKSEFVDFCGCNPALRSCNRILVVRYRQKLYTDNERRTLIRPLEKKYKSYGKKPDYHRRNYPTS